MAVAQSDPVRGEPFLLQITAYDHGVEVAARGALDLETVADLRQLADALRGTTGPVTLDLGGLTFVDSTGISGLLAFKGELDLQLRELTVVQVRPETLDVLRMLGVDDALGLF